MHDIEKRSKILDEEPVLEAFESDESSDWPGMIYFCKFRLNFFYLL